MKNSGRSFKEVEEKSVAGNEIFLERCLVGRVENLECPIPSRSEVQKRVDLRWRMAGGVRVVDMNEKYFLFEFPSKEEAARILQKKDWVLNQMPMFLDRWNAVGCCHCEDRKPEVAWIRALGLPLHLWGNLVFQEIGRRCGGFIKIDDATKKRTDLRWARILVRYRENMPACICIGVGRYLFSIPIWAETTAFCQYRRSFGGNGVFGRSEKEENGKEASGKHARERGYRGRRSSEDNFRRGN